MAEMINMAQVVANAAVSLYSRLPSSGKPRDDEYSVLAAVVAVASDSKPHVLALGTGTKCIGRDIDNARGCYLSDSHAEVVARRAFVRFLYQEIYRSLVTPTSSQPPFLVRKQSEGNPQFMLNQDYRIYMYVSDSPCGDAAVYETSLTNAEAAVITGARPLDGCVETVGCLRTKCGRGDIAADVRTTSMSCSDKISRWCCLGLQGEMLSPWIEPVYMTDIVVDRDELAVGDSQRDALQRAVQTRWHPASAVATEAKDERLHKVNDSIEAQDSSLPGTDHSNVSPQSAQPAVHIPEIWILDRPVFSHGKARMKKLVPTAAVEVTTVDGSDALSRAAGEGHGSDRPPAKRRKRNPLSPCGFSINWIAGAEEVFESADGLERPGEVSKKKTRKPKPLVAGGTVEVTVAHTGVLQGTVRDSVGTTGAASRLSRHCMRQLFEGLVGCCARMCEQSELAARLLQSLKPGLQTLTEACADQAGSESADNESERPLSFAAERPESALQPSGIVAPEDGVLQAIRTASYRRLKKICGGGRYADARAEFLKHPVFKHWLCDDDDW